MHDPRGELRVVNSGDVPDAHELGSGESLSSADLLEQAALFQKLGGECIKVAGEMTRRAAKEGLSAEGARLLLRIDLATSLYERQGIPAEFHELTKKELDVLGLITLGLSNFQASQELFVTEQTVKFHLSKIYRKLGVSNRTEAAAIASLRGLLPIAASSEAPGYGGIELFDGTKRAISKDPRFSELLNGSDENK